MHNSIQYTSIQGKKIIYGVYTFFKTLSKKNDLTHDFLNVLKM